ncbi:Flp family type IVb pilin [Chloroflexota bacterium]
MLKEIRSSVDGQDLVEYALLTGLIAIVLVAGISMFGSSMSGFFVNAAEKYGQMLPSASPSPPECYGSLLLPIMAGITGLGVGLSHLVSRRSVDEQDLPSNPTLDA